MFYHLWMVEARVLTSWVQVLRSQIGLIRRNRVNGPTFSEMLRKKQIPNTHVKQLALILETS